MANIHGIHLIISLTTSPQHTLPPQHTPQKRRKKYRTDDAAILRSFVNCQPELTLQKTNREHGGSHRLLGECGGKERAVVFANKETFCLPFAAAVKSATNMEIHYGTLLKSVTNPCAVN